MDASGHRDHRRPQQSARQHGKKRGYPRHRRDRRDPEGIRSRKCFGARDEERYREAEQRGENALCRGCAEHRPQSDGRLRRNHRAHISLYDFRFVFHMDYVPPFQMEFSVKNPEQQYKIMEQKPGSAETFCSVP